MDTRWRFFLALLVLGSALAAEDESLPDLGDEDEEQLALDQEESRNIRPRAYTPQSYSNSIPTGFRPTPSLAELAGYQRPQQEAETYLVPARQQQQNYPEERPPTRTPHRKPQEQQRPSKLQQQLDEEELEEKEEPDRLSQLLQQSKFNCVGKNGYYADEELNCEVFHYCQDSVKHSWICPDGFTFHQVHLICMPPNHDNICQKSSKYHFVNEYLYRPVNEEEVQRKPNVTLRYSDRYYPVEVYRDDRYDQDDEEEEEDEPPRRHPVPQQLRVSPRPQQAHPHPQPHPHQQPQPQVFRSAEEVNIPLGQRRPQRPYDFDF